MAAVAARRQAVKARDISATSAQNAPDYIAQMRKHKGISYLYSALHDDGAAAVCPANTMCQVHPRTHFDSITCGKKKNEPWIQQPLSECVQRESLFKTVIHVQPRGMVTRAYSLLCSAPLEIWVAPKHPHKGLAVTAGCSL